MTNPREVEVSIGDRRYSVDTIGQTALKQVFTKWAWRWRRVSQKEMNSSKGLQLILKAEDALRAEAEGV